MQSEQVIKRVSKTDESWVEHLHALNATRFLRYGEHLNLKFPRPIAPISTTQAAAKKSTRSSRKESDAAPLYGRDSSEELRRESDRRYLRMVVKSAHGGYTPSPQCRSSRLPVLSRL
eukprot:846557-Rhodomonas_salina.2